MRVPRGVRAWFRLRRRTAESLAVEVEEEIALHIEMRVRDLRSRGMDESEARIEAKRRFGDVERARLQLQTAARARERRQTRREWLAGWREDFRYALRALSRERLLALVIVLTLALGLGANTIMFGVIDHLLLRGPAHVVAPEQVRRVYVTQEQWTGHGTSWVTGYVTYTTLRDRATSFAGVAAYRTTSERLGAGESAREVTVGWSTADMFPLLGVSPRLGRFHTAAEDRPRQAANVAVLDHGFWQSEYGGTTDVLGRTVSIDGVDYTVIGVAPAGFTGPELQRVSVWLPFSTGFKPHPEWPTTWNARWLHIIVRTRPGVALEAAAAEATSVYRAAAEGHDERAAEGVLSLRPLRYGPTGEEPAETAVARWLFGVSVIVLLIAAANVMNLLLARTFRRHREISVRLALGISRRRLARLLLSESLVLALAGLGAALVLAYWGAQVVRVALLPDVQWGAPLDERVLSFAAIAALATGLLVGLVPVLHSGRSDLTRSLRAGPREGGGRRAGVRTVLTVMQAAFSVVLLVGAGLFVRSLWNVSRVDLGVDADRVLAAWVTYEGTAGRDDFLRSALARLHSHPGIESAALALGAPLQGGVGVDVRMPGRDSIPDLPGGGPYITGVTTSYFETVGTRILRGRGFEEGEGAGTEPVMIVSQTMANTIWPAEDPLTKCLIIADESSADEFPDDARCARVVGVAEDAHRTGIVQEPVMQYYVPLGQERGVAGTRILVRPRGNAVAFVSELRRLLHALDPAVRYLEINPLQSVLDPQIRPWRLGATLFLVFGAVALVVAAIGLYSVLAYAVAQRSAEIGVRMALGARARSIVGMIVREGVGLVLLGVILGSAVALAAGPLIEPLLFETAGRDAFVVATVSTVLVVVAVLASFIPALRAGGTDPLSALRAD
jgi:predicted permease